MKYVLFKIESDIEQDEDAYTDDKNSVTTDDEFYNELMDAPSEAEDHLSEKNRVRKKLLIFILYLKFLMDVQMK